MAHDDRVLLAAACNLLGVTLGYHGELTSRANGSNEASPLASSWGTACPFARFVVDPEVSMRANLCQPLVQMGCQRRARRAHARGPRASRTARPADGADARALVRLHGARFGSTTRTGAGAGRQLQRIVTAHGVAQGEGPGRWYRGWALARLGDPTAATA